MKKFRTSLFPGREGWWGQIALLLNGNIFCSFTLTMLVTLYGLGRSQWDGLQGQTICGHGFYLDLFDESLKKKNNNQRNVVNMSVHLWGTISLLQHLKEKEGSLRNWCGKSPPLLLACLGWKSSWGLIQSSCHMLNYLLCFICIQI